MKKWMQGGLMFIVSLSIIGTAFAQKIVDQSAQSGQPKTAAQQQTPDTLKQDAINKIRVAKDLMQRANVLVTSRPTTENLRTAVQIFAESGQLFQEANGIFRYLGTNYVSQSDIDNTAAAVKVCMDSITKLKEILNKAR
ncbi:MAG: hypothetical protein PHS37_10320 [Candidatus Omnitrophica bacterium]|nr:hypothetical protein [Candidatus Omnitrophota bacterium]